MNKTSTTYKKYTKITQNALTITIITITNSINDAIIPHCREEVNTSIVNNL
nr:MAG TPA: hypothetical protein [Caudoviricetes sp.]